MSRWSIVTIALLACAEMIGLATLESDVLEVTGRATDPRELRLVPRAIDLELRRR